jgi:DNA helicase HerA-like ATPase
MSGPASRRRRVVTMVLGPLLGCGVAWEALRLDQPVWFAVLAGLIVMLAIWPSRGGRGPDTAPTPASPSSISLGDVARAPPQARAPRVGQPFSLELADLDQHVSIIGATGSGKTTTVSRFMEAALGAGWAVTVLDAKGGNLAETVRRLGQRHQVEATVWLPGADDSSTYDVCAGDAAAVSNRLLGAFEHGRDGEVYRQLSQALLPLFVRALEQSGKPWDLETLRASLNRARLVGLARKVQDEALRTELLVTLEDALQRKTLAGMQGRLGALRNGAFGSYLLPSERTLDMAAVLDGPRLTYLGLPATGASEDVALVGRVLIQHLKQLAYDHLRQNAPPALVVLDEFATLREAVQLTDLLLQGREAGLSLVVSSQFLPRLPALRQALLGAGVLIVHRIGSAEEAELLARTLGMERRMEVTRQLLMRPDAPPLNQRTVRPAQRYLASPDELSRLAVGEVVVSVRHREPRLGIVEVSPLRC